MDVEFIGQSMEYVGGYGGNETIESAARMCTQTEVGDDSERFVENLRKKGHTSSQEFGYSDVLIECDRAIQQELTRHRHFSFNIESTRLINYTKRPLRFITKPLDGWDVPDEAVELLESTCAACADAYQKLLDMGAPRDYARKALPLATASRMRMAGDSLAWKEMIEKRTTRFAHPEVREIAWKIREELEKDFSGLYGDEDDA
jgi:thymidylate synthase (FAD)